MTITDITADLVDRHALAAALGVSIRMIGTWKQQPDGLPHIRIGNRDMYRPDAVREWLLRREVQWNPRRGRRQHAA